METIDPARPGTVFTMGFFAFSGNSSDRMRHAMSVALTSSTGSDALSDALSWVRAGALSGLLKRLRQSSHVGHRAVACGVLSKRRAHDVESLRAAIDDSDAGVRAIGLRGVGEMGATDLTAPAQRAMDADADSDCRFWAAWSLGLLGDSAAARMAFDLGVEGPMVRDAVAIGMRCGEPVWARQTIRDLASSEGTQRLAVMASGAFGDPVVVKWLVDQCTDPKLDALAGEAISMITGVDLRYLDLERGTYDDSASEDLPPEDQMLPRPDIAKLREWWKSASPGFSVGTRYLAGHPISKAAALGVLLAGYQRQRAAAALEFARLVRPSVLFPVDTRADRQARKLAA
jgi:uncharacterized protein (TIGR02270 family)